MLDVVRLDASPAKHLELFVADVLSDDTADVYLGEERGCERDMHGRSAEHALARAEWRLDRLEDERPGDGEGGRARGRVGIASPGSSERVRFALEDDEVLQGTQRALADGRRVGWLDGAAGRGRALPVGGELGPEQEDVRAEIDQVEEGDDRSERPVDRVVVAERAHVEGEAVLQQLEADGGEKRAEPHIAKTRRRGRDEAVQDRERDEREQRRHEDPEEERTRLGEAAERAERRLGIGEQPVDDLDQPCQENRRENEDSRSENEHEVDQLRAYPRPVAVHVPDHVQSHAQRAHQPARRPERDSDADEPDDAPRGGNVGEDPLELAGPLAGEGHDVENGVDELLSPRRVPKKDAEDRDEEDREREDREDEAVRDGGGQLEAAVVGEGLNRLREQEGETIPDPPGRRSHGGTLARFGPGEYLRREHGVLARSLPAVANRRPQRALGAGRP